MNDKLAILMENEIVHGDIKPANIMSSSESYDNFRIIDFKAAKKYDELTNLGSIFINAPEKNNINTLVSAEYS